MNYGMCVKVRYVKGGNYWKILGLPWQLNEWHAVYHNVTEVHYKYPEGDANRMAVESDIHGTGSTFPLAEIAEFEVTPETAQQEAF